MATPASATSLPGVQSDEFEGPLDLLLDEVRRQNVAIDRIAMAPIVARYLEYIRTAGGRSLNLDIEWLHMAATLIQWKSQSLLPQEDGENDKTDPIRDHLVQQLVAHRKQAAEELGRRQAIENTRFSRVAEELREGPATVAPDPAFVTVWDLIQQARDLAHWVEGYRKDQVRIKFTFGVEPDDVSVAEMIEYLVACFAAGDVALDGTVLLQSQPSASRRACLFLGMLEMMRDQRLEVLQKEAFGSIWMRSVSVV